jgi:hypothetical protein
MRIIICTNYPTINGLRAIGLEVDRNDTVRDLVERLRAEFLANVCAGDAIYITFNYAILEPRRTLAYYGVRSDSILKVTEVRACMQPSTHES